MPDKVKEWTEFLRELKENFNILFERELFIALESLNEDYCELFDSLERGINKA
ncbi:316_t:CDS:1, partial [Cetraspora pellucida]